MDAASLINLGLLVVTAIAAAFAAYQAVQARKARTDAREASDLASTAARDSAAASVRSAAAAERQAAAAEAQLRMRDPWEFNRVEPTGTRWKVTNRTDQSARVFSVESNPGSIDVENADEDGQLDEVVPQGASFYFNFGGSLNNPNTTQITINWWNGKGGRTYVHDVTRVD